MPVAVQQITMVNALAITNTTLQIPTATSTNAVGDVGIVVDCRPYWEGHVEVESTLNQIVGVQIYAGIGRIAQNYQTSALMNYVALGPQFFLPAGNTSTQAQIRVMSAAMGTMPWMCFLGFTAQVSPTAGSVSGIIFFNGLKPGM